MTFSYIPVVSSCYLQLPVVTVCYLQLPVVTVCYLHAVTCSHIMLLEVLYCSFTKRESFCKYSFKLLLLRPN